MGKVAIYARKSVSGDNCSVSIKGQIEICKKYYTEPCEYVVFIDDNFSGGTTSRPKLKELISRVKASEFKAVLFYRVDRFARNALDFLSIFELFKEYNTDLISVSEQYDPTTPTGKMMMVLIASIAETERENIRERAKSSMNTLAMQGRWTGGTPPMGYKVISEEKGKYLELVDGESILSIYTDFLGSKGILRLGNEYNCDKKRISRLLANPTYIKSDKVSHEYLKLKGYEVYGKPNGNGYLPYGTNITINGKKVKNKANKKIATVSKHSGVINSTMWIEVQEKLKLYSHMVAPSISKKTWLAQKVRCSCGSGTTVTLGHKKKDGSRTLYFKCSAKCGNTMLRVDLAENTTIKMLQEAKTNLNILYKDKEKRSNKTKISNLDKNIKTKNKILDGLLEKMALASNSTTKLILTKIENLNTEIDNLVEQKEMLLVMESVENNKKINKNLVNDAINNFLENMNSASLEDKRIYMNRILKEIIWNGSFLEFVPL